MSAHLLLIFVINIQQKNPTKRKVNAFISQYKYVGVLGRGVAALLNSESRVISTPNLGNLDAIWEKMFNCYSKARQSSVWPPNFFLPYAHACIYVYIKSTFYKQSIMVFAKVRNVQGF